MNLYFQFLTQNQSRAAINLIRLPALLVPGKMIGGKSKLSTGGRLLHSTFSSIETLSAKLAETHFNELEVIYDIGEVRMGTRTAQVGIMNGVFYPSTTCELWFSWKDFPLLEDRRSRQRRMMAKTDEEAVAYHQISSMPCVFEVALEIETSLSKKQVFDICAVWLAKVLNKIDKNLEVFGCCDFGGKELHVRLETHVPMIQDIRIMAVRTSPMEYPELGKKIENLHPIMFGAKDVYFGIASALGKDAKIMCGMDGADFAVVRLSPACDIAAAKKRASHWLLPTIR